MKGGKNPEHSQWVIGKIYLCHVEEIKVNDLRFDMLLYFSNHVVEERKKRERDIQKLQKMLKMQINFLQPESWTRKSHRASDRSIKIIKQKEI